MNRQGNHYSTQPPGPAPQAGTNATSWNNNKNIWYTNSLLTSKTKTSSQHRRNSSHQHGSNKTSPDNQKSIDVQSGNVSLPKNNQVQQSGSVTNTNSTFIGHYELKKTLGKGNFSTVKQAIHRITQHSVAIKVVKTSTLSEDNLMKINREIEVLKKIGKQNHIVRLYQVIKTKRYFMLVTEYCANGELYDYIVDKGRLSESLANNYFLQILLALEYLHDHNIVHRDLKAENLLLTDDYKTVKIADFGFANYYKQDKLLSTWCGSPPYAAPELFRGLHYVGPPVDIWSLGVILYVLVCGSLPFDGHNLVFLKSRVLSGKFRVPFFMSTECEALIRGMLRLDPEKRFNIRQIRSHNWNMKHSNGASKRETVIDDMRNTPSIVYMDTNSSNRLLNVTENQTKEHKNVQVFDKNNSNRGQSLDLEVDKKIDSNTNSIIEDVSMLSLASSNDEKLKTTKKCTHSKASNLQNFVDIEIANAVSNMSIESNNSSMSVSQSIEPFTNHLGSNGGVARTLSSRTDCLPSVTRNLSKENSIDDQIIDFMVNNLKVAETQSSIRQSIANDKYDDLQAIYKLIKDDPKILYDSQISTKFKIPSLPVISLKMQTNSKKPSITTGFFNTPNTQDATSPLMTLSNDNDNHMKSHNTKRQTQQEQVNIDYYLITNQTKPVNMVTKSNLPELKIETRQHRGSDDQTWKEPPQLFLTPPAESRNQTYDKKASNQDSDNAGENSPTSIQFTRNDQTQFSALARHSFDSTLQQMVDPSMEIPGFCNNKLTLTSCAQQSLWDSSILDTLGVSTPSHRDQSNSSPSEASAGNSYLNFHNNTMKNEVIAKTSSNNQNIVQITTNLPQIGQMFETNLNQHLLLAHLNSIALSAGVTQSGVLSQSNTEGLQTSSALNFTPNNLINQNYTNMNNLQLTNVCSPNLSLLDPNCLTSGLERRASDGQASYSSLTVKPTTGASVNLVDNRELTNNNTILSSSSNQVSSDFNDQLQKKMSTIPIYDASKISGSNRSIEFGQSIINQFNSFQKTNYHNQQQNDNNVDNGHEAQVGPLDLTQNSQLGSAIKTPPIKLEGQYLPSQIDKSQNQRSQSTTSGSIVFNHLPSSASTSPRNSLFISSVHNNNIFTQSCQTSPSTLSLTGGGPGHLLNRRKRHSLETESRPHYCHHHHHHYNPLQHYNQQYQNVHGQLSQYGQNLNLTKNNTNDPWIHKPQYPANSHIGQLRNFAQTFNYNKSIKKQSSLAGWIESSSATKQAGDTNTKDNRKIQEERKETDRTRKG